MSRVALNGRYVQAKRLERAFEAPIDCKHIAGVPVFTSGIGARGQRAHGDAAGQLYTLGNIVDAPQCDAVAICLSAGGQYTASAGGGRAAIPACRAHKAQLLTERVTNACGDGPAVAIIEGGYQRCTDRVDGELLRRHRRYLSGCR